MREPSAASTTKDQGLSVGLPRADDSLRRVAAKPAPPGRRVRLVDAINFVVPALLAYVAVRAVGLIALSIFAGHAGVPVLTILGHHFDATWYSQIADRGYDSTLPRKPDGSLATTNLSFFPLFPALIALVKTIFFLPTPVAGVLVAWLAGLAAAWGIFALGNHVFDRRTGVILVALWAALPTAVVESMAYSETTFTALAAWTLLAVLQRRWLVAGLLAVLAGLSRPTATCLIAAVCAAALVAIIKRRDGWRPWVALILSPLGYAAYIGWVGLRLRRLDGYFYVQKYAWHLAIDGGVNTVSTFERVLTHPQPLAAYVSALTVLVAVMLLVLSFLQRQPWPLLVYSTALVLLTVGTSQYFASKGRYLIPAVTLLLPAAVGLAKARRSTTIVVLGFVVLVSAWYGTYLSLVWTASP